MIVNQLDVKEVITKSIEKINQYPGGNRLFFTKLGMSRTMVSQWKSGRARPSEEMKIKIMVAATETISECEEEKRRLDSERDRIIGQLQSLISA